jgi:hypothetical protein
LLACRCLLIFGLPLDDGRETRLFVHFLALMAHQSFHFPSSYGSNWRLLGHACHYLIHSLFSGPNIAANRPAYVVTCICCVLQAWHYEPSMRAACERVYSTAARNHDYSPRGMSPATTRYFGCTHGSLVLPGVVSRGVLRVKIQEIADGDKRDSRLV